MAFRLALVLWLSLGLGLGLGSGLGLGAAHAQTAPAALPESKFYVGLQASYMRYPGLDFGSFAGFAPIAGIQPLAGTVGFVFRPEVAVELAFTRTFLADQRREDQTSAAVYSRQARAYSLLGRSRVWQSRAARPWSVELVMGGVVLEGEQYVQGYYRDPNTNTLSPSSSSRSGINDVQLALGAGAGYQLSRHWQLTGEVQGQISLFGTLLNSMFRTNAPTVGGGVAAGIRYHL